MHTKYYLGKSNRRTLRGPTYVRMITYLLYCHSRIEQNEGVEQVGTTPNILQRLSIVNMVS